MQVISAHELISKLLQNTANAVTVVDVRDEVIGLHTIQLVVFNGGSANGETVA